MKCGSWPNTNKKCSEDLDWPNHVCKAIVGPGVLSGFASKKSRWTCGGHYCTRSVDDKAAQSALTATYKINL